ncbi:MAG: S1 family peptidase [Alphaproteobacteria bacterium]|nr:S1 family peptidase [Alphaproteobacteria bacterium]
MFLSGRAAAGRRTLLITASRSRRPRAHLIYGIYGAHLAALLTAALLVLPSAAQAVVKGQPSALGAHVVRIYAGHYCSGVAIGRQKIVTARHCVTGGMRIVAGGRSIGVARIGQSGTLDDGRRVSVQGDAAIVRLASPLPASVVPVPVAEDGSEDAIDSYTIAGFGTPNEAARFSFGTLREARLVAAEPRALVDPTRTGSIGASACFGDSGGAVMRGGALIGVISRAAHPHPRIACGHLTRWAPVIVAGAAETTGVAVAEAKADDIKPAPRRSARTAAKRGQFVASEFSDVPRE